MLRVVLDTNAIKGDYFFGSNPARLVFAEAERGKLQLIVPEIVVMEVVNLYRQDVAAARAKFVGGGEQLIDLVVLADDYELPTIDPAGEAQVYDDWLRNHLRAYDAEVLPLPETGHRPIVE